MSSTDQQHYPIHPPKRNGRNGDPPGNGRHYPHRSGGGCDGPHGTPVGGFCGSPDDP